MWPFSCFSVICSFVFAFKGISTLSYPIQEMITTTSNRFVLLSVNSPWRFVWVFNEDPFNATVAAGIGFPSSSTTFSVIYNNWKKIWANKNGLMVDIIWQKAILHIGAITIDVFIFIKEAITSKVWKQPYICLIKSGTQNV
jgi:hypothetical protein